MSINVTVTGSPVSIKRGRMVTSDCDASKKEFERRRLIRLEQVRQQSKDIAENVRNRVRQEKTKQQSQLEKQGEVQLKQWQARKLLELQNQYQEALDDLGLGHKQARAVELEEEHLLVDMKESNEEIARKRGEIAAERLQIDKNEASLRRKSKESQIIESRKNTFNTNSNNRSGKSPFKKRRKSREPVDSDSENLVPVLVDLDDENLGDSGNHQRTENSLVKSTRKVSREQQTTPEVRTTDKSAQTLPHTEHHELTTAQDPSLNLPPDNRISDRIKRRHYPNSDEVCTCTDLLEDDDRIVSPRITQSQIPVTSATTCPCCQCWINVDGAGKVVSASAEKNVEQQQQGKDSTGIVGPPENGPRERGKNVAQPGKAGDHPKASAPKKDKKIPNKPKITLRSAKEMPESGGGGNTAGTKTASSKLTGNTDAKVKYYDHPNRHSKFGPSTSRLERIDDESLQMQSPEGAAADDDEREYFERMRQRDLEAHLRGQKAMEKERIRRDYRDLLKKLPVLQKQERLYDISGDRPEYHMPDDRLREMERRKQNRLDNAYESLMFERGSNTEATFGGSSVRQPALVTLPRRQGQQQQDGGPSGLNLGELSASWDVDFAKLVGGRSRQPARKSRDEELLELLENLKAQKNELLKEVQQLPIEPADKDVSAKNDLDDLTEKEEGADDDNSTTKRKEAKNKRKRSRDDVIRGEAASDVITSDTNVAPTLLDKVSSGTTTTTTTTTLTNSGAKSSLKDTVSGVVAPSPRKKPKLKKSPKRHRRKVLILQNTSTQTTPKLDGATSADASSQAVPSSQVQLDRDQQASECPKDKHYSCACPDLAHDRVCEILIKINEQDQPEVVVNPPCLGTNVNVVLPASPKKSSKKEKKSRQDGDAADKASAALTKTPMTAAATTRKSTAPWKLHLSQQSSSLSTASTSYFSPPDFQRKLRSGDNSSTDNNNSRPRQFPRRSSMKRLTPPATIAGSFDNNSTKSSLDSTAKLDPRLLTYVKKLLNMSRASIEDLTVSTGSEVSTPSQSVIEMPSNDPLSQLRSVIKYFNIDPLDLQRQLHQSGSSSNETTKHYNTERSVAMPTEPSDNQQQQQQQQQQMSGEHSTPSVDRSGNRSVGKAGDDKGLIDNGIRDKAKQTVAKYADIAESCNRKISSLTAMIEKVRAEKRRIMQSPPATICGISGANSINGDNVTNNDKSKTSSFGSKSSSRNDETDARLLEIDLHYAERLKLLTPEELVKEKQRLGQQHQFITNPSNATSSNSSAQEQELLVRLRRLLETSQLHTSQLQNLQVQTSHLQNISSQNAAPSPGKNSNLATDSGSVNKQDDAKERATFVPLLDIKKLPKLDDVHVDGAATSLDVGVLNKKRPPPSKGMKVMQAVPHELSTIVEATDSLVSTRLETKDKDSKNNSNNRSGISDRSSDSIPDILSHIAAAAEEEPITKSPQDKAKNPQKKNKDKPEEKSPTDRSSGSASQPASLTNNSTSPGADKSDGDAMEVMLHSIGMEWAIPTLRKTREALAMASTSSNSSEKSKNKQDGGGGGSHNNSTDVSLREFLARHLSLNSSGGANNYSPTGGLNFGTEIQEISGVYLRRTSTPVQQQQQQNSGGGGSSAEKSDPISADSRSRTADSKSESKSRSARKKSQEDRDVLMMVRFGGESEDLSSVRNEDVSSATKKKIDSRDGDEPERFYDLQEESTVSNNKTMG